MTENPFQRALTMHPMMPDETLDQYVDRLVGEIGFEEASSWKGAMADSFWNGDGDERDDKVTS